MFYREIQMQMYKKSLVLKKQKNSQWVQRYFRHLTLTNFY